MIVPTVPQDHTLKLNAEIRRITPQDHIRRKEITHESIRIDTEKFLAAGGSISKYSSSEVPLTGAAAWPDVRIMEI